MHLNSVLILCLIVLPNFRISGFLPANHPVSTVLHQCFTTGHNILPLQLSLPRNKPAFSIYGYYINVWLRVSAKINHYEVNHGHF
jgi:hypothetical protein